MLSAQMRLSLPFATVSTLHDSQKAKLIRKQAQRLQIASTEVDFLINFCSDNACMASGCAILYEYAQCIDDNVELLARIFALLELLETTTTTFPSSSFQHFSKAPYLLALISRLAFVLSRWRKLQRTWIPIFINRSSQQASLPLADIILHTLNYDAFVSSLNLQEQQQIVKMLRSVFRAEQEIFEHWQQLDSDTLNTLTILKIPSSKGNLNNSSVKSCDWRNRILLQMETCVTETKQFSYLLATKLDLEEVSATIAEQSKHELFIFFLRNIDNLDLDMDGLNSLFVKAKMEIVHLNPLTIANLVSSVHDDISSAAMKNALSLDAFSEHSKERNESIISMSTPSRSSIQSSLPILSARLSSPLNLNLAEEDFFDESNGMGMAADITNGSSGSPQYFSSSSDNNNNSINFVKSSSVSASSVSSPLVVNRSRILSAPTSSSSVLSASSSTAAHVVPALMKPRHVSDPTSFASSAAASILPKARTAKSNSHNQILKPIDSPLNHKRSPLTKFDSESRPQSSKKRLSHSEIRKMHHAPSILFRTLQLVDSPQSGLTIQEKAAKKIKIWFRFVFPRYLLKQRLQSRQAAFFILDHVLLERVMTRVIYNQKQRQKWLKIGAATRIQLWFRKTRLIKRQLRTEFNLYVWANSTLHVIRVVRYLRRVLHGIYRKRGVSTTHYTVAFRSNFLFEKYLVLMVMQKKIELQKGFLRQAHAELTLGIKHSTSSTSIAIRSSTRPALARSKTISKLITVDDAAIMIQKIIRSFLIKIEYYRRLQQGNAALKIAFFIIRMTAKKRKRQSEVLKHAVLRIQKFRRGLKTRREMYDRIHYGLKLKNMWRKHIAYKALKAQLRRVDRPFTLVLHGVRNIGIKQLNTEHMKVKVSVWWHPLLHIVSAKDYVGIIKSKQPQYLYTGTIHKVFPEIDLSDVDAVVAPSPKSNHSGSSRNWLLLSSSPSKIIPNDANNINDISDKSDKQEVSKRDLLLPMNHRRPLSPLRGGSGNVLLSSPGVPNDKLLLDANAINQEQSISNNNNSNNSSSNSLRDTFTGTSFAKMKTATLQEQQRSFVRQTLSLAAQFSSTFTTQNKYLMNNRSENQLHQHINGRSVAKDAIKKKETLACSFDDETIKIPGCHGNSVIKFELYDGERKMGNQIFYMGHEGEMMYWGGEYSRPITSLQQQHRAVQLNANIIRREEQSTNLGADAPIFEFQIIAGAALRSRCQWARLVSKGSGPLKRALQTRSFISTFSPFDTWTRFYLSLDEFGLHLFENKFNTKPLIIIPISDFKAVSEDADSPIAFGGGYSKNYGEDLTNIKLATFAGEEIFMRFPDSKSRQAWLETLTQALNYFKRTTCSQQQKNGAWLKGGTWLNKFFSTKNKDDEHSINSSAKPQNQQKQSDVPAVDLSAAIAAAVTAAQDNLNNRGEEGKESDDEDD